MSIRDRINERGLVLAEATRMPPGIEIPFRWVRVHGDRAYVSGHGPLHADGSAAGPFGSVPSEVPLEAAQESARLAGLAILGSLERALGDLDRIVAWLKVDGFINADPGYERTTAVLNPLSDLILDLFGPEVGAHARTAVGAATVPLNLPLVVAAELQIRP